MIQTIVLPLSIEWWTAETLAPQLGVSVETVYRRARELRERGVLEDGRCIWTSSQARKLAVYIVAAGHKRGKMAVE